MKRVLAMVTAVMVIFTLFAACAKKEGPKGTGSSEQKLEEKSQTAPKKPKKVTFFLNYHPDVEKFKNGQDINNNDLIALIREKSGINVEFNMAPKDGAQQKFTLLIASGDIGDLAFVPGGKSDVFKFATQDVFEPLDDLIKTQMPDYTRNVKPDILSSIKYGGKSYALLKPGPYYNDQSLVYRADLFEKLNIKDMKTLDNFYSAMKLIKEKAGIIPFSADGNEAVRFFRNLSPVLGAYGIENFTFVKDGKLVLSYAQPEFKEFIAFAKKLYDEGLLDKEFAVNKINATRDKMIAGQVAMGSLNWSDTKSATDAVKKKNDPFIFKYAAAPEGKDGKSGYYILEPVQQYYVIPKSAKEKEGAAQLYNFMFTDAYQEIITYGKEGVSFAKEGNKIKLDNEKYLSEFGYATCYNTVTTKESYDIRLEQKGFVPYYNDQLSVFKFNRNYIHYAPPIEDYNNVEKELQNYAYENAVKFIMGSRGLDEFDKYVNEFNTKGGKSAVEAIDAWYQKEGKNIK